MKVFAGSLGVIFQLAKSRQITPGKTQNLLYLFFGKVPAPDVNSLPCRMLEPGLIAVLLTGVNLGFRGTVDTGYDQVLLELLPDPGIQKVGHGVEHGVEVLRLELPLQGLAVALKLHTSLRQMSRRIGVLAFCHSQDRADDTPD